MNQAFQTLLHLHEGAVILQTRNTAFYGRACRISFLRFSPWIGCQLFHTKRYPLPFLVKLQDLDLYLVADLGYF